MPEPTTLPSGASYDIVGRYRQDDVNGFPKALLNRFLDAAEITSAGSVLDAMAGDGNLTLLMHAYCRERGIPFPETTVLEYSRVQCEFARSELRRTPAKVLWGDVLSMASRETGERVPDGSFDRVLLKSGNHEIPKDRQLDLYRSLFRTIKPGGTFVNLGFLYDSEEERDEIREIAKVKDTWAGMSDAVRNRHFLTRREFYGLLQEAGFVDVRCHEAVEYVIRSNVVAEQYFPASTRTQADLDHQAAQVRALHLRRSGRIRFEGAGSIMQCPGEITIARRPTQAQVNSNTFRQYPMDFLRKIEAHVSMLQRAARHIAPRFRVLEVGCGIGLLAERLVPKNVSYEGFDVSAEFVAACRERLQAQPGFMFEVADANSADLGQERHDAIAVLNTLNLPGIDAVGLLRRSHRALRHGGRIIVTGPTSAKSFTEAEPRILAQLERDGFVKGYEGQIEGIRQANSRLLTEHANYWSVEGMSTLLRELGFRRIVSADNSLYYGSSYLVVAEK